MRPLNQGSDLAPLVIVHADTLFNGRYSKRLVDSLDKAERSATRLKEFFGNTKAHALKGDSIKRFIAQRQTEGAANATINRDLALLKRAYNLGIEAEKIVRKPTSRNSKRTIFAAAFLSTLNLWPCAAHVLTTSSPW